LPTRSCCDGLLFVVDIWPEGFGKGGVCCLCEYVVAKHPDFDLAGAYLACCGKDVDAVKMWRATDPTASNCDDPCGLGAPPPPPPHSPSPPGGGTTKWKQQTGPGAGAIVASSLAL
ncbi:hypothetical protein PVAP13_3NG178392, partial [Panicum virgatum]